MARSRQNRGQDVPAPDPGYRMSGGRLYYFDGHGRAFWVQDDTGTQAARPAEQAWQPPLQGPDNVGRAYSTAFEGAVESNTHSSAAMDPRAYGSGGSQDPRVQVCHRRVFLSSFPGADENITGPELRPEHARQCLSERATSLSVLDDDQLWELSKVCSCSTPLGKRSLSCNSTAGSYRSGIDTSPVQASSHTRGIDDSNANYSWGMVQFVENQTVPVGVRNYPPSLSIEVSDTMELYYDKFPEDADPGRHGRHLSDSDENERGRKRRKASQTKSKDGKKKKPKDDGNDKKKTKDDRKDKKKPKDDRKDKKKNGEPTE
ncbi:hypothetical protein EDB80DRAFT_376532 [Ilyonectria destructans]|nr:hypothetical protein EDB80DRAFT_376532 [Ilyonectria destructans]